MIEIGAELLLLLPGLPPKAFLMTESSSLVHGVLQLQLGLEFLFFLSTKLFMYLSLVMNRKRPVNGT